MIQRRKVMKTNKAILPLAIILLMSFCGCGNANEDSFNDAKANNGKEGGTLQLPSAPRNYCVTLETLVLAGDFETEPGLTDPELYGAICAISSEDPFIAVDNTSLQTRLQNCEYLYFVRDNDVFASGLVLNAASIVTDFFDSNDLQDLSAMLTGAASPTEQATDTTYNLNTKATIRIQDFKNRPILLATIFMADDDLITDDPFYDPTDTDTNYADDYPLVKPFYDSEIPPGGAVFYAQQMNLQGISGNITLNFKVERGVCP